MIFKEESKPVQTWYNIQYLFRNYKWEMFWVAVFAAVAVAGIPLLMEYIAIRSDVQSVISNSEWVGFLSSYLGGVIGGFITLGGVFLTLGFYRKQDKNKIKAEKKKQMTTIYWFLKFKLNIVETWEEDYKEVPKEKIRIPVGGLLTKEDFSFFLERLESVQEIFGQESAKKLMLLYDELDSVQLAYDKFRSAYDNKRENVKDAYIEFRQTIEDAVGTIDSGYREELEEVRKYINNEPLM